MTLALGLMSGTSADGVSLALIRIAEGRGRAQHRLEVLAHATFTYPKSLKSRILEAPRAQAAELCRLHFELGAHFAQAAKKFLKSQGVNPARLAAVGSHGQTIIHLPNDPIPATLQIGEPSFLAEALGVPVVSDFRPRDMAAGGQGAPLVPFLDQYLFGRGPARAIQNIGGIGNVTLVGKGVRPLAFDTGPGNCLIDAAVRRVTHGKMEYDEDGRMALRGRTDFQKAKSLIQMSYFRRRPPKSLDRSAFSEMFLDKLFARDLRRRPNDVIATLTYFTALTIQDQYRKFLRPLPPSSPLRGEGRVGRRTKISEVIVSGGGALNPVLMEFLKALLAPVPVVSSAQFGIHPLAKEPAAFALMALEAVRGRVNHVPQGTGAAGPRILGKITPA